MGPASVEVPGFACFPIAGMVEWGGRTPGIVVFRSWIGVGEARPPIRVQEARRVSEARVSRGRARR
jgi:hypothetical protein